MWIFLSLFLLPPPRYWIESNSCKSSDSDGVLVGGWLVWWEWRGHGGHGGCLHVGQSGRGLKPTLRHWLTSTHPWVQDLSWNPQDNRQAEDRAHRLGQQKPVTVTYLTTAVPQLQFSQEWNSVPPLSSFSAWLKTPVVWSVLVRPWRFCRVIDGISNYLRIGS